MADPFGGMPQGPDPLASLLQGDPMAQNPLARNLDYQINGPAAGVLADQIQNQVIEAQKRKNDMWDLGYNDAFNTYQQNLANNPLREQERQLAMQKLGIQSQLTGQYGMQQGSAAAEADIAKNLAGKSQEQLQGILSEGAKHQALQASIDSYGGDVNAIKEDWDTIRKQAKDDLGQDPGEFSLQHLRIIKANAAKAVGTADYLQKYGIVNLENQGKTNVAKIGSATEMYKTDSERLIQMSNMDHTTADAIRSIPDPEERRRAAMAIATARMYPAYSQSPENLIPNATIGALRAKLAKTTDPKERAALLEQINSAMDEQARGASAMGMPNPRPATTGAQAGVDTPKGKNVPSGSKPALGQNGQPLRAKGSGNMLWRGPDGQLYEDK